MTSRINLEGVVGVAKVDIGWTAPQTPGGAGFGGTPIHYLYGYVPPNGVVILKLPI